MQNEQKRLEKIVEYANGKYKQIVVKYRCEILGLACFMPCAAMSATVGAALVADSTALYLNSLAK